MLDKAIYYFSKALEIEKNNPYARTKFSLAQTIQLKWKKGILVFKFCLNESTHCVRKYSYLLFLANEQVDKRKFEYAVELYTEILAMDQSNEKLLSKILVQIGRALFVIGDLRKAILALTDSLDRHMNSSALRLRSKIHFMQRKYKNAISDLKVAFDIVAEDKKQKVEDEINDYKIKIKEYDIDCYCSIVLGNNDNADLNEIKSAYKKLAILHHPDKLSEKPREEILKNQEIMAQINFAKAYLENKYRY